MKITNLSDHTIYCDIRETDTSRTDIEIKCKETKEVPIEDNELVIS